MPNLPIFPIDARLEGDGVAWFNRLAEILLGLGPIGGVIQLQNMSKLGTSSDGVSPKDLIDALGPVEIWARESSRQCPIPASSSAINAMRGLLDLPAAASARAAASANRARFRVQIVLHGPEHPEDDHRGWRYSVMICSVWRCSILRMVAAS